MNAWFSTIWLLTYLKCACAQQFPEVLTRNGKIKGFQQSVFGKNINTFLGIPFAEPPIGDLRFRRPRPVKNWDGVLNATIPHKACHQVPFTEFVGKVGEKAEAMWNAKKPYSEDCLYLNIWVPEGTKTMTTMLWIFGGGYFYGSANLDLYDGKYLASYADVIVVSINYRVGPLGFLYLGTDDVPGNMGLLDQVEAMRWVSTNIAAFNGSAHDITIFGESAGASSISFHLMSEMSEPYFQRAILQSASSLSPWAFYDQSLALKYARDYLKLVNCTGDYNTQIRCLMNSDPVRLTDKQWSVPITALIFPFAPTIDNYFLKQTPRDFVAEGRFANKSLLVGVDKDESVYFLLYWLHRDISYPNISFSREHFLRTVPYTVSPNGYDILDPSKDQALLGAVVREYESEFYSQSPQKYMDMLDDMGGDYAFKCPVIKLAQEFSRVRQGSPPIFMYSFEHRTTANPWPEWAGVLHGDEVEYIFGATLVAANRTGEEKSLCYSIMEYFSNFAKKGYPGSGNGINFDVHWPEYTSAEEEYIVLQAGEFRIQQGLRHRQCAFWMDYYPQLRKNLTDAGALTSDNCVSGACVLSLSTFNFIFLLPVIFGLVLRV